ncbi:MAG: helix-turn-helix transcriptional regulator [Paramuribaculum sp.]|nr:helix-turn-helix transcriptional regulator [Paramuribaculum sp.]
MQLISCIFRYNFITLNSRNGLKRADLAARLGVSPQYVSKLLSGTENLSFKSVANIEDKLGISCFAMA